MTDDFGKYINPFTDFGFKKLFGTEFNKELLIHFLNQVLGEKEKIKDLTYLNNEVLGKIKTDRSAVFDLYCKNENGELFIVELQNVKQEYYIDRSIFYSTFPIQSQAPKGKGWDYQLKAVYTVGILNFSFSIREQQERYRREVMLIDKHTGEIFYEKLTFIYLEIANFKKAEEELKSLFDKWMYVLQNLSKLQERPKKLQGKIFRQLFEAAEIAKLEPEEMRMYDESLKIYRDNENSLEYAKKLAAKEGLEEGMKKGLEKGMKKGLEKGKELERTEIAKILKKNGASFDLIEKSTGFSREQIEKLD